MDLMDLTAYERTKRVENPCLFGIHSCLMLDVTCYGPRGEQSSLAAKMTQIALASGIVRIVATAAFHRVFQQQTSGETSFFTSRKKQGA